MASLFLVLVTFAATRAARIVTPHGAFPEPSTALLLASGLVAMAVGRRRRTL